MSSLTASTNRLLGLSRFFFPGSSTLSILLPIYPSSFPRTSSNHLSLASRVFSPNRPTCAGAVPLMYSFLILSVRVTPNDKRNIFNTLPMFSNYSVCSAQFCTFASFRNHQVLHGLPTRRKEPFPAGNFFECLRFIETSFVCLIPICS